MDPVSIATIFLAQRIVDSVIVKGFLRRADADEKKDKQRLENDLKRDAERHKQQLEIQRENHRQRLEAAKAEHRLSMEKWAAQTYYKECWPLRNPFEMQICESLSNENDSKYSDVVPCRLICSLVDDVHPYARTINDNLSSFVVNYYSTNGTHGVVSEIGAWRNDIPANDASVNYLFAGLKKQPVMVLAPSLINDGKTFILKVWSWGLGEDINYPAGMELGRIELEPLYRKAVLEETLKMVDLVRAMHLSADKLSPGLQRNISVANKAKGLEGKMKERMMSFLDAAPEIDDAVKKKMENQLSGVFCCIAGMYADAYHLLEYGAIPKLPTLLRCIPGVGLMLPALREFYVSLLNEYGWLEENKEFLARLNLDIAEGFSNLPFTFRNQEEIVRPFTDNALCLYMESNGRRVGDDVGGAVTAAQLDFADDRFVRRIDDVRVRAKLLPNL